MEKRRGGGGEGGLSIVTSEDTRLVSPRFGFSLRRVSQLPGLSSSHLVLIRVATFHLFPSRLILISLTFGFDNESKNFLLSPLGFVSF